MHPAVARAHKIGNEAVEHGWTGHLDSQMVSNRRITTFGLDRGEEHLTITWTNTAISDVVYDLRGVVMNIKTNLQLRLAITSEDRPDLTNYPRVGEKWTNEQMIDFLKGTDIFWWDSVESCVRHDHVLFKQNKQCKVMPVGHRKMFQYNGLQGQRNVLIDTILKVI